MGLFEVLKQQAAHLDADAFRLRHTGYYLLAWFPDFDRDLMGFNTGKVPAMPDLEASGATSLKPRLWRVEKSDRNAWSGHISVGRAKNNDVVIRQRPISKLHAHLYPPKDDASNLQLMDVGSENGTEVNGEQLPPDVVRDVHPGDEIVFGGTACQLLDADLLLAVLSDHS